MQMWTKMHDEVKYIKIRIKLSQTYHLLAWLTAYQFSSLPAFGGQQSLSEQECSHVHSSLSQPKKECIRNMTTTKKYIYYIYIKTPRTFSSWMVFSNFVWSEFEFCNFWLIIEYASTILSCSAAQISIIPLRYHEWL